MKETLLLPEETQGNDTAVEDLDFSICIGVLVVIVPKIPVFKLCSLINLLKVIGERVCPLDVVKVAGSDPVKFL